MRPSLGLASGIGAALFALGAAACVTGGTPAQSSTCGAPPQSSVSSSGATPVDLGSRLDAVGACSNRASGAPGTFPAQRTASGPLVSYFTLDGVTTSRFVSDDACAASAHAAVGAVRVIADAPSGAKVDAHDPKLAFRMYTDICGMMPIRAESGWYEGWLVHDLEVPSVADADKSGHASFARITSDDAAALARMGEGENTPGRVFTVDGRAARASDRDASGNTLAVVVSTGSFNSFEGEDAHAFFNLGPSSSWSVPAYEWLGSGGAIAPYANAVEYASSFDSRLAGSGPSGVVHTDHDGRLRFGDDPAQPRDPDRSLLSCPSGAEQRMRGVPSGLAREILFDAFVRPASFEPNVFDPAKRLADAYAYEVALLDANKDGVLQPSEVVIDAQSQGQPNTRLFLPVAAFARFLVTREINDGLLSPRFAPSPAPAVVLAGGAIASTPINTDAGDASDFGTLTDPDTKNGESTRPQ